MNDCLVKFAVDVITQYAAGLFHSTFQSKDIEVKILNTVIDIFVGNVIDKEEKFAMSAIFGKMDAIGYKLKNITIDGYFARSPNSMGILLVSSNNSALVCEMEDVTIVDGFLLSSNTEAIIGGLIGQFVGKSIVLKNIKAHIEVSSSGAKVAVGIAVIEGSPLVTLDSVKIKKKYAVAAIKCMFASSGSAVIVQKDSSCVDYTDDARTVVNLVSTITEPRFFMLAAVS